jgi:hypothetical protein
VRTSKASSKLKKLAMDRQNRALLEVGSKAGELTKTIEDGG